MEEVSPLDVAGSVPAASMPRSTLRARLAELLQQLKPAWRNGVPAVTAEVSEETERTYLAQELQQKSAMQAYAARVDRQKERLAVQRPAAGGRPRLVISDATRMRPDELKAVLGCAMPEQGDFAQALNRRNARFAGVAKDESFEVGLTDGSLVAVVLRGVLRDVPPEIVVEGYDFFAKAHDRVSNGWFQGCEADQAIKPSLLKGLLRTEVGAAAMGITKGHEIHTLEARSGDASNRLQADYTSTSTKEEHRGEQPPGPHLLSPSLPWFQPCSLPPPPTPPTPLTQMQLCLPGSIVTSTGVQACRW